MNVRTSASLDPKLLIILVKVSVHGRHQLIQFRDTFGSRKLWISVKRHNTEIYENLIKIFCPIFSSSTCDLANAKIRIPQNLVKVIPLKTLPPSFDNASLARSSFVPWALQNALTICETNSTPIPMHCYYDNNNEQKWLENDYYYYWQMF